MNLGYFIVQQEAAERAMRAYRAKQAAREQRRTGNTPATGLGRGTRRISREEAAAIVAKKNPRGALRLIHSLLGGRTVR